MIQNIKTLFLIDGIGGLATGFTFAFIVPYFPEHIGIPKSILLCMSIYGFLCGAYSLYWHLNKKIHFKALKFIVIANSIYCCLSMGIVLFYLNTLSVIGFVYFLIEKIIILTLVYFEVKLYKKNLKNIY